MNKAKQIEEMARIIQNGETARNRGDLDCTEFPTTIVIKVGLQRLAGAKELYNAGYRKASEVAELEEKLADVTENWQKIHDAYTADCIEHYHKGRSEVAREIFGMLREDLRGFVDMEYIEKLIEIYEKKYKGDKNERRKAD